MAASGDHVIVAGRTLAKLEELSEKYETVSCIECDIADSASLDNLSGKVTETFGVPQVLTITAGVQCETRTLESLTEAKFQELLDINVAGVFGILKRFVPMMREQPDGHIVLISSIAGTNPSPAGGLGYAACKHALVGMVNTLRLEKANKMLRFSIISPGPTDTPFVRYRAAPVPESVKAKMLTADAVAKAVAFVASLPYPAFVEDLKILPVDFPVN